MVDIRGIKSHANFTQIFNGYQTYESLVDGVNVLGVGNEKGKCVRLLWKLSDLSYDVCSFHVFCSNRCDIMFGLDRSE
jgi:hypothetical protein